MADKVKLVYDGPIAAVDIPVLRLENVAVGDEVEVPADVAAELVERGDWKPAKADEKSDDKPAKAAQNVPDPAQKVSN